MDVLCVDFINSDFRDFRGRWVRDDLLLPEWWEQFLTKWGLQVEQPLDAVPIAEFQSLRSLLQRMIADLAEGPMAGTDLATLNAILLRVPLSRKLIQDADGYQVELAPEKQDWDWIQAEIAASFAQMLTQHDPRRLKLCENPYCRGAFFDDSKSRTKRYCTPDKCANLMKARRFRARHRG
jgi:predicted RNA-binding Zn ribbon-like protein